MIKLKLKPNKYKGKLIVFEGTDGAGKTTLLEKTCAYLKDKFGEEKVLSIKQPTDLSRKTKLFQKMMYCSKNDEVSYVAVQLLTMSDRVQQGYEVIEKALLAGKFVVSDRYIFTSLANMLARGYKKEKWFFLAAKEILKPDFVFLANVNPDLALKRIKSRKEEENRYLDELLLKGVHNEFLKLAKDYGFFTIDTTLEQDISFENVLKQLEGMLK